MVAESLVTADKNALSSVSLLLFEKTSSCSVECALNTKPTLIYMINLLHEIVFAHGVCKNSR